MLDITSFIREKIFRRPKLGTTVAWEDISEKQTSKLGYFLLFCMFWAIMSSAQWTLSIIEGIPTVPMNSPYCINNIINTFDEKNNNDYYSYSYYNDCTLTSTNPLFDFTNEYNKLKTPFDSINNYKKELQSLQSQKSNLDYKQRNSQNDYNTSLTEKIANENNGIYDKNNIQNTITDTRLELTNIETQISNTTNSIKQLQIQFKTDIDNLIIKVKKVEDDYKTAYLLYRMYVAILSFIFAIIVFTVLYRIYVKQKTKNSPNTIIFSVATFAYWLILLQISALFIWDIIPHRLLVFIQKLFELFTPLVYLVQFLWPLFIVAIFWFLVYRIQKRLYSPSNILKRFLSDKRCPSCWNSVDFTKPFCPICSHEIQNHCPKCNELTIKWMPYCSSCGSKI